MIRNGSVNFYEKTSEEMQIQINGSFLEILIQIFVIIFTAACQIFIHELKKKKNNKLRKLIQQ